MSLRTIILPAAAIVIVGGGIGLADWSMRNEKVSLSRKTPPPPPPVADKPPAPAPQPAAAPNGAETPAVKPPPTPQQQAPTPPGPLPAGHLTIGQAKALFDQGSIFVDARKKESYVEGHVAGAFRADMASFKSGDPAWLRAMPKDLTMVVYCNGGNCDESEHVAQLLDASGFSAVYVMHDGFPGWKAAGYPSETGEGQE